MIISQFKKQSMANDQATFNHLYHLKSNNNAQIYLPYS